MKRLILSVAAAGFLVAAYQGAVAASTTAAQGQVRLLSTDRCNLVFQFQGFQPGAAGRLEIRADGVSSSLSFHIPSGSGVQSFRLHGLLGEPNSMVQVSFKLAVEGMNHVMSGTVMVNCDCGSGGGGGGSGGGSGSGSGSVSSADAATAISGSPGFAG